MAIFARRIVWIFHSLRKSRLQPSPVGDFLFVPLRSRGVFFLRAIECPCSLHVKYGTSESSGILNGDKLRLGPGDTTDKRRLLAAPRRVSSSPGLR